jgi:uncharacterized membrane protein YhaH (DUF805 family)
MVLDGAFAGTLVLALINTIVELGPYPGRRGTVSTRQFWVMAGVYMALFCWLILARPTLEYIGKGFARHPSDARFVGEVLCGLTLLVILGVLRAAAGLLVRRRA